MKRGSGWREASARQRATLREQGGRRPARPALPPDSPFQRGPAWRDLLLLNEYFHGETGQGLGAMHQTGWTGLVANLVQRKYRVDLSLFWKEQQGLFPTKSIGAPIEARRAA